jgi:hypothetical protein
MEQSNTNRFQNQPSEVVLHSEHNDENRKNKRSHHRSNKTFDPNKMDLTH